MVHAGVGTMRMATTATRGVRAAVQAGTAPASWPRAGAANVAGGDGSTAERAHRTGAHIA